MTFSILLIVSCRTNPDFIQISEITGEDTPSSARESLHSEGAEKPSESGMFSNPGVTVEEIFIREKISTMTIDEKIGQLFILAVRHTAYGKPALTVDDTVKDFLKKYKPGGIILFTINFQTPLQTKILISDLQKFSSTPLFIATDEEGGKVSRLGKSAQMEVISLPPAAEIGATKTPELAEKSAEVLGLEMKELGFNMNMAPVADVVVPGEANPIGSRSYSSDPENAGAMTAAAVKGFLNAGISPVLKHFPGHGNVGGDSHNGSVSSRSSREEFYSRDFVPFIKGIEAGSDFVMMGHISAPALSGNNEPASLSYDIQTGILRRELGFSGLIITDAMDMGAIKNSYDPGIASLKAFMAGTDIILMPESIPDAQRSLKKALENGTLSMERLDESVRRILKVKIRNGLFDEMGNPVQENSSKERLERHTLLVNQLNSQ